MKTNQEYKNAALARIEGTWSPLVVASIVYMIVLAVIIGGNTPAALRADTFAYLGGIFGSNVLLSVFIASPMSVGLKNAFNTFYVREEQDVVGNLWKKSTDNYLHKVLGMLSMNVKIFLWTLLFFIPGIVMSFAYAMTPYILEDNPEISAWDASTKSREMMKGHKFDLFYLYLSFFGWYILCLLTCGIGFIWLIPYLETTVAAFYNDIKGIETD